MWLLVLLGCSAESEDTKPSVVDTGTRVPIPFCINEFMPSNGGSLQVAGATPDWIELHNPGDTPLALDGFSISDDLDEPQRAPLDGLVVPASGQLLLFANGVDLPFNLRSEGEVLLITSSDGRSSLVRYGDAATDVSWSRQSDCCEGDCWVSTVFGTPGESNEVSQ